MARWRFAGGTLKFPLTLPAGDYIYKLDDGQVEMSSSEPITIDLFYRYLLDSSEELILDSSGEALRQSISNDIYY